MFELDGLDENYVKLYFEHHKYLVVLQIAVTTVLCLYTVHYFEYEIAA